MQQQLARQQMLVEAEQDKHATTQQVRLQKDAMLDDIRALHREMAQQIKNNRQQSEFIDLAEQSQPHTREMVGKVCDMPCVQVH